MDLKVGVTQKRQFSFFFSVLLRKHYYRLLVSAYMYTYISSREIGGGGGIVRNSIGLGIFKSIGTYS